MAQEENKFKATVSYIPDRKGIWYRRREADEIVAVRSATLLPREAQGEHVEEDQQNVVQLCYLTPIQLSRHTSVSTQEENYFNSEEIVKPVVKTLVDAVIRAPQNTVSGA